MQPILGHRRWPFQHMDVWKWKERHNVALNSDHSHSILGPFRYFFSYAHSKTGCIVIKQNVLVFSYWKSIISHENIKGVGEERLIWCCEFWMKFSSLFSFALSGPFPACSQHFWWVLAVPTGCAPISHLNSHNLSRLLLPLPGYRVTRLFVPFQDWLCNLSFNIIFTSSLLKSLFRTLDNDVQSMKFTEQTIY